MKMRLLKYLVLVVFLGLSCAYYNTFYNAEQFFKQAKKEREKRLENLKKDKTNRNQNYDKPTGTELQSYDKAIEKASKVLELYPKSKYVDDALMLLGQCFYHKKENLKAVRKFKELLENYPDSDFQPEAELWLARTYVQMERWDEAKDVYNDIKTSQAPREIKDEALVSMGELYFVKEDYVAAAHEFKTAINNVREKDYRAKAAYRMGECYTILKDYESASEAFKLAEKYSPEVEDENDAIFQLAKSYKMLQNYDEAIANIENLLGRQSYLDDWPLAKIELANCIYLKHKQKEEQRRRSPDPREDKNSGYYLAVDWYLSIIQDHPRTEGSARAYYHLAEIYRNDFAMYDSAYVNYIRVKDENRNSVMTDSANAKADGIVKLMALIEVVKKQEFERSGKGTYYNADLDIDVVDESTLDDSTRYKLRKERTIRRLKMWRADHPAIFALPDTLIADSLFADSLGMVDSIWVRDEDGLLVRPDRYELLAQNTAQEEENLSEEELALRRKKEALEQKLAPMIKDLEKNKLIKNKSLLAEEYMFNYQQYDSALVQYKGILNTFPDSLTVDMKPQILYSMSYVYKNVKHDSVTSDSLIRILANDYAQTPHGKAARKILNLEQVEEANDVAKDMFQKAETEYVNNQNFARAIDLYKQVETEYPQSEYASKSLFAAAWIYDNLLNDNESALQLYEDLMNKYPESKFGKTAKQKISAFEKAKKDLATAAKQDSIRLAGGEIPDSLMTNEMITDSDSTLLAMNASNAMDSTLTSESHSENSSEGQSDEMMLEDGTIVLRTEPRRPRIVLFPDEY